MTTTTQTTNDSAHIKRIVIKVGSNVLTNADGLDYLVFENLGTQMAALKAKGYEIILVSSGAVAAGMRKIGLSEKPPQMPQKQALAAIGQADLIHTWEKVFEKANLRAAQILLTSDDLSIRKRYLNARNTLLCLLAWNMIPIINENDSVVVDEIKLGDNDNLGAMIALLVDADLLVNLSDIDGLYDKDPRKFKDAKLLEVVPHVSRETEKYAGGTGSNVGTGGMLTKIKAARKTAAAGIPMIIANAKTENVLGRLIIEGEKLGTLFTGETRRLSSRKCWLAFSAKPKGAITVNWRAASVLRVDGKSLLPVGIVGLEGNFGVGSAVCIQDEKGLVLGQGLVNYASNDIRRIMGHRSEEIAGILGHKPYDEVIHRDNMVLGFC